MAQVHRDNGGYLGIDVRETADPWFDNVVLLLQPDAGDTTIVDKSPSAHSITNNGVTLDNTNQKWTGAPSLLFERANSDNLKTPDDTGFAVKNFDFTVECFAYLNDNNNQGLVAQSVDTDNWVVLLEIDPGLGGLSVRENKFNTMTNYVTQSGGFRTTGVWTHLAAARQGDTFRLFIDGSLIASDTSTQSVYDISTDLEIGSFENEGGRYVDGSMTSIRITKGVARYTSNFTPPTRPFPTRRYASGVFQP